jgi:ribosome-associated protein
MGALGLNCSSGPSCARSVTPHDDRKADEPGAEPPSKSARKRAARAAQDLGEALTGLRDAELEALELPEALLDAIRAARRITSRAAAARQRQYIGRLMREADLDSIRAALDARAAGTRRDAERFRQITAWRERLIAEGPTALTELSRRHPQIDRNEWARRIEAARAEHVRPGSRAGAGRELFRALRALFDTMPR